MACDLLSEYGVDVYDRALLRARPWSWLEGLIVGLLANPETRVYRALVESQRRQNGSA